jgi:hypothetical protein
LVATSPCGLRNAAEQPPSEAIAFIGAFCRSASVAVDGEEAPHEETNSD